MVQNEIERYSFFKHIEIKFSDWNRCRQQFLIRRAAVAQRLGLQLISITVDSPCLSIYVAHHCVKRTFSVAQNIPKGLNMALVHIYVCVCWELLGLPLTSTPLMESGIQLVHYGKLARGKKIKENPGSHDSPQLRQEKPWPREPPEIPLHRRLDMSGKGPQIEMRPRLNHYWQWNTSPG